MKRIFISVIVALACITGYAEVTREGNNFKVEQTAKTPDTQTKYTWEDKEGNKYPIFVTKKGACYIIRTSKKTGKEYRQYLPKEIQEQIKKELGIN